MWLGLSGQAKVGFRCTREQYQRRAKTSHPCDKTVSCHFNCKVYHVMVDVRNISINVPRLHK